MWNTVITKCTCTIDRVKSYCSEAIEYAAYLYKRFIAAALDIKERHEVVFNYRSDNLNIITFGIGSYLNKEKSIRKEKPADYSKIWHLNCYPE